MAGGAQGAGPALPREDIPGALGPTPEAGPETRGARAGGRMLPHYMNRPFMAVPRSALISGVILTASTAFSQMLGLFA